MHLSGNLKGKPRSHGDDMESAGVIAGVGGALLLNSNDVLPTSVRDDSSLIDPKEHLLNSCCTTRLVHGSRDRLSGVNDNPASSTTRS